MTLFIQQRHDPSSSAQPAQSIQVEPSQPGFFKGGDISNKLQANRYDVVTDRWYYGLRLGYNVQLVRGQTNFALIVLLDQCNLVSLQRE